MQRKIVSLIGIIVFLLTASFIDNSKIQQINNKCEEQKYDIPISFNIQIKINEKKNQLVRSDIDYSDEDDPCGFEGDWDTKNPLWQDFSCTQSGSTVHCDYYGGNSQASGSIDGALSADGKVLTGKFTDYLSSGSESGPITMTLTDSNHFSAVWSGSGWFNGERIGDCQRSSFPQPEPLDIEDDPDDQVFDICAGVTCKNNYCKDDGSKYYYDCECSPADGKCTCRYDSCEFGCDATLGGCVMGEADLCADANCPDEFCSEDGSEYFYDCYCDEGDCYCDSVLCDAGCDVGGCLQAYGGDPQDDICDHVICPEDYCEADGKTRIYDCKCDPADGECGCLVEVCEAGCNAGTGKCEITMVIPADQDDTDSGGSSGGGGYTPSPTPEGPGLLGVIGGVAAGGGVLAGAGYLGYKAVQAALARQAAKAAAKAAAEAAEPSLSELLGRLEKTTNRATEAIDSALKANAKDVGNYKEFLARTTAQNEDWSEIMTQRAKNIEWAETGVRVVKKGADMTAELLGNVPGVGRTFKYTYNLSTTAAESIASGDSVGTVALKTTGKAMETAAGDAMFGKVTLLKNLPTRMSMRTIKIAARQVGPHYLAGEGLKNEATLETMNWLKAKKSATWFGKVEKGLAKAGKKIDTKFVGKTIRKILYR